MIKRQERNYLTDDTAKEKKKCDSNKLKLILMCFEF